jgi:hypothetical protein
MSSNRKDMPKHGDIVVFWCDKLIEEHGKYWLDVFYDLYPSQEKLTYVNDRTAKESPCFACGAHSEPLQRCHIKALCEGGSNAVDNIHLLCRYCHLESEMLSDNFYWKWFDKKIEPSNKVLNNAIMKFEMYSEYLRDPEWPTKYGNLFQELKDTYLNPKRVINIYGLIDEPACTRKQKEEMAKQREIQWEAMMQNWIQQANQQKP